MSIDKNVQSTIEAKLTAAFSPSRLEVINESHLHAGHQTYDGTGETHFRVVIISDRFTGMNRVARHRTINDVLKQELAGSVHALALEPSAPDEPTRR